MDWVGKSMVGGREPLLLGMDIHGNSVVYFGGATAEVKAAMYLTNH